MQGWNSNNSYPEEYFRFTIHTKSGRLFEIRKLDHGKKYCIDGKTLETLNIRNWNISQYKGNHDIEINIDNSYIKVVMDGQVLAKGDINNGQPIMPVMIKSESRKGDYDDISINFQQAPMIINEPLDVEAYLGESVVFNVSVVGNESNTYIWYKNGKVIKNENKSTLEIPNIKGEDISIYSVKIENQFGSQMSRLANLNLKTNVTLETYIDLLGRQIVIAYGPKDTRIIFQSSNDLINWKLMYPKSGNYVFILHEGQTLFADEAPINTYRNSKIYYRAKLIID